MQTYGPCRYIILTARDTNNSNPADVNSTKTNKAPSDLSEIDGLHDCYVRGYISLLFHLANV